ncbi:hypothetical protein QOZ80_5AG0386670 [Eleusine coracana subsp. coracana]|nr:hypothetical protein QOZ80_5AG0386670 [Eleusine coracana subsp. coracana]
MILRLIQQGRPNQRIQDGIMAIGLCASSSGCERNWSTFEFIHTKKRNRMLHKRLNAIVFVSYNRKMKTRFQIRREKKEKSFDPLVIDEFDWDNEWADSLHVPPQGERGCDCDMTWEQVDEVVGASQSLYGRNVSRRAHMNSRGGPITYSSKRTRNSTPSRVLEDEVLDCTSDGGEDDPHDDADVSDCGDTSDGSNDARQDMGAANTLDECDDGY